jgi:hypothetical protein
VRETIITTVKTDPRFGPEGMTLWRLTGAKPGHIPAWFRRILTSEYGGHFDRDWFDHHATCGDSLLVEPYHLDADSARDILDFADRHSLNVTFSATSHHFPTTTIAIFFTRQNRSDR